MPYQLTMDRKLFFRNSLLSLGDAERRHSQLDNAKALTVPSYLGSDRICWYLSLLDHANQKGGKTDKALEAAAWMQEDRAMGRDNRILIR